MPGGGLESLAIDGGKIDGLKGEFLKNPEASIDGLDAGRIKNLKYKIGSGDTLSGIAKGLGTTVDTLAKANGISDVDKIYAGATISVSIDGKTPGIVSKEIPKQDLQKPSLSSQPKASSVIAVDAQAEVETGSKVFKTEAPELTFDEKISEGKVQIDRIESSIKKEIDKGTKFTKAQQEKANEYFKDMLTRLNAEKGKTQNPEDTSKVDQLITQLEKVQKMYNDNVIQNTNYNPKLGTRREFIVEDSGTDLSTQEVGGEKAGDKYSGLKSAISSISDRTSLLSEGVNGISFNKDSGVLVLGEDKYKVDVSSFGIPIKPDEVYVQGDNIYFEKSFPIKGKQTGVLPKGEIFSMFDKLASEGQVSQSMKGGTLKITKI